MWIWHGEHLFYGFPVYGEVARQGGPGHDRAVRHPGNALVRARRAGETGLIASFLREAAARRRWARSLLSKTCVYDMPPDRDFIIDRVPGHPAITIGTGRATRPSSRACSEDPGRSGHERRDSPTRSAPSARPARAHRPRVRAGLPAWLLPPVTGVVTTSSAGAAGASRCRSAAGAPGLCRRSPRAAARRPCPRASPPPAAPWPGHQTRRARRAGRGAARAPRWQAAGARDGGPGRGRPRPAGPGQVRMRPCAGGAVPPAASARAAATLAATPRVRYARRTASATLADGGDNADQGDEDGGRGWC